MGAIEVGVVGGVGIVGHSLAKEVRRLVLLGDDVVMSLILFDAENFSHS